MGNLCIGMFGTCGTKEQSPWRAEFKAEYEKHGINYFDPQKDDWSPQDAIIEADHLADDQIILFPITSMTHGFGSLSEVGFSILHAIKLDDRRDFVVMIDDFLDDSLTDLDAAKESLRSRALVKKHLEKLHLDNLYVVQTLEEMLDLSKELYEIAKVRSRFTKFNPHRK